MKCILFSVVASVVTLSSITVVNAQYSSDYRTYKPEATAPIQVNYPFSFPNTYRNHASTSEQGMLMGLGDLYRGAGEYELANSIAAYNWQLARAAALQNNVAERAARAQVYRHSAISQELKHRENMKKNQAVAQRQARERESAVASTGALNPKTGSVKWPILIYEKRFETARLEFEGAFQQKSKQPSSDRAAAEKMANSIKNLEQRLDADQNDFRRSDYFAARGFLERMKTEISRDSQSIAGNF